jgi:hypothetical protein
MTKIQTILSLFLFLVIIFSMDMIFGNPICETFTGITRGSNVGIDGILAGDIGSQLNYTPPARVNTRNGNMIYSGSGLLGVTSPYPKGDDQPLFFGFSS